MERLFYHYDLWEDYHAGMYDEDKDGRGERVKRAAYILGTPSVCQEAMQKVIDEWDISTKYNLSNAEINRKAWLGQAACCCFGGVHEDETREAWGLLTDSQRKTANAIANEIIKKWLQQYEQEATQQTSLFDDWGNMF